MPSARRPRRRRARTPPPPTPHSSALAARLARLPHAALAELCAATCTLDVPDSRRACNAALARHDPTPAWAVEHVLLSPDLAPRFMGALATEDGTAAAVCRVWRGAWDAVWKLRRTLRPAPLTQPNFDLWRPQALAALPDWERLCIACENRLLITDRLMRWQQTIGAPAGEEDAFTAIKDLAASDDGMATTFDHICAVAASADGIYVAEATEQVEDEEADEIEISICARLRECTPPRALGSVVRRHAASGWPQATPFWVMPRRSGSCHTVLGDRVPTVGHFECWSRSRRV